MTTAIPKRADAQLQTHHSTRTAGAAPAAGTAEQDLSPVFSLPVLMLCFATMSNIKGCVSTSDTSSRHSRAGPFPRVQSSCADVVLCHYVEYKRVCLLVGNHSTWYVRSGVTAVKP